MTVHLPILPFYAVLQARQNAIVHQMAAGHSAQSSPIVGPDPGQSWVRSSANDSTVHSHDSGRENCLIELAHIDLV